MTETPTRPLILLVDDDPVVRLTLARALTDRGYDVRTAADGQAAITILEGLGTLPAIAIIDLHMASGTGEQLAQVLARRYPDLRGSIVLGEPITYSYGQFPSPVGGSLGVRRQRMMDMGARRAR
jgi:CheY-like chemotaxis protein